MFYVVTCKVTWSLLTFIARFIVVVVVLYRTGSELALSWLLYGSRGVTIVFFDDLNMLERLATSSLVMAPLTILGDFNIHVDIV